METTILESQTGVQFVMSAEIDKITAALCQLNQMCDPITKDMTVGEGKNSYKGMRDGAVKAEIGGNMANVGLALVPIHYATKSAITSWSESYGVKRNVFTETHGTYLLSHISGQYMTVAGYGHGVDSQDKAAGKTTTYALKNILIYISLAETTLQTKNRAVDDTDQHHSDDLGKTNPPPKPAEPKNTPPTAEPVELPWLNEFKYKSDEKTPEWTKVIEGLKMGYGIEDVKKKYKLSSRIEGRLQEELKNIQNGN